MYGKIPCVSAPSWIGGLHRWSGRIAFLLAVPVAIHCLYALGFQTYSTRVLIHSLLGCAFFGAFTVKMLILPKRGVPDWVLPVGGRCGLHRADRDVVHLGLLVLLDFRHQPLIEHVGIKPSNELRSQVMAEPDAPVKPPSPAGLRRRRVRRRAGRMCRLQHQQRRESPGGPPAQSSATARQAPDRRRRRRERAPRPGQHLRHPGRRRQDPGRQEDRDHPAAGRYLRRVHRGVHPSGLHRRHRVWGHHQLPVSRQQVQHRQRLGGQRPGQSPLAPINIKVQGTSIIQA